MKIFNGHIEEKIILALLKVGTIPIADLILSTGATKQGVYRVLRKLKKEEKIVIFKSTVSINDLWVFKLRSLLPARPQEESLLGNLNYLGDKEKMSIKVKTLTHADQIWTNIFLNVEQRVDSKSPLYIYNPHNWFYLLREKTDYVHIERLSEKKRKIYLTVGSDSVSDLKIKQILQTDMFRYSLKSNLKLDRYIAVLGDYVIEIILPKGINKRVATVFSETEDIELVKTELFEIDKIATARIVVEKNSNKATLLKRRLSKGFIV